MFRQVRIAPLALIGAAAVGAVGIFLSTEAPADVFVRGSKARIVTTPAAPVGSTRGDSGYYVPYVTGPGGQQVPVMQVPGSVTVVPRRLMDDTQATTLGEALRYVPGVFVGR